MMNVAVMTRPRAFKYVKDNKKKKRIKKQQKTKKMF